MSERSFRRALAAIALGGLFLRVVYAAFLRSNDPVWGDAFYYHHAANLLADGEGFISPIHFRALGERLQAADHPPLYTLYLAAFSLFGMGSQLWHQLASCLLGTVTVVVVGLAGRRLGGPLVGLIAAVLAALYPNIWSQDGMVLSETMAMLTTALVLLLAYRSWQQPSRAALAWVGVAVGLCALTRAELILFVPLVVFPLALLTKSVSTRERWTRLLLGGTATALVIAPWVGYNLTRFERPVLLSNGLETTLRVSNCEETYYGPKLGYWEMECALRTERDSGYTGHDQAIKADYMFRDAKEFVLDHLDRVPTVVAARVGRVLGLYQPLQQANFDISPEGRERWVAFSSLGAYYVLTALAVAGAIALRRRGVPLFPLMAPVGTVLFAVVLTFATNRYRAPAEITIVLLAAIALEGVWRWWQALRDDPEDRVEGAPERREPALVS